MHGFIISVFGTKQHCRVLRVSVFGRQRCQIRVVSDSKTWFVPLLLPRIRHDIIIQCFIIFFFFFAFNYDPSRFYSLHHYVTRRENLNEKCRRRPKIVVGCILKFITSQNLYESQGNVFGANLISRYLFAVSRVIFIYIYNVVTRIFLMIRPALNRLSYTTLDRRRRYCADFEHRWKRDIVHRNEQTTK